jgi:DnaB-helicase binding domain of primase
VDTAEWRKATRDKLTAEIIHHDRNPVDDAETDRLIASLNRLMSATPLAEEEKLTVVFTKLVELLVAIDDEAERNLYVQRIRKLLSQDVVEAARAAFKKF